MPLRAPVPRRDRGVRDRSTRPHQRGRRRRTRDGPTTPHSMHPGWRSPAMTTSNPLVRLDGITVRFAIAGSLLDRLRGHERSLLAVDDVTLIVRPRRATAI